MNGKRRDEASRWGVSVAVCAAGVLVLGARAGSAEPAGTPQAVAHAPVAEVALALDFAFYRARIEPIFLRPRGGFGPGTAPCASCHTYQATTPLKLEPLTEDGDRVFWTEEQSRRNFEVVARLVVPRAPDASRLLLKPLSAAAGGRGNNHTGGTFWQSKDDPEWRVMAEWVQSASADTPTPAPLPVLDFEFFRRCVQPVFVNPIPNAIACAECHSGGGARAFAVPIAEGQDVWTEEESRRSYAALMQLIEPGHPEYSRFLHHPLDPAGGGDFMHNGGRRWQSKDDPEWQALAAWVRGESRGTACPPALRFQRGQAR